MAGDMKQDFLKQKEETLYTSMIKLINNIPKSSETTIDLYPLSIEAIKKKILTLLDELDLVQESLGRG